MKREQLEKMLNTIMSLLDEEDSINFVDGALSFNLTGTDEVKTMKENMIEKIVEYQMYKFAE